MASRGLLMVLCGALALAALIAVGKRIGGAWTTGLAVTTASAALGAGVLAAGAAAHVMRLDCERFDLDPARWTASAEDANAFGVVSDRERMTATMLRCGTLDGRSRPEVRALLGAPSRTGARLDVWPIGWVNDLGIGIGDEDRLRVRYTAEDRVTSVRRAYD